jgi:hypothetical protein
MCAASCALCDVFAVVARWMNMVVSADVARWMNMVVSADVAR